MWQKEYGLGESGLLLDEAEDVGSVLVVGEEFPWWALICKQLRLSLHSIYLEKDTLLALVSTIFKGVPVWILGTKKSLSVEMESKIRSDLKEVNAVALERHPVRASWLAMWLIKSGIDVIMVSESVDVRRKFPPGWDQWRMTVRHELEGGVTNARRKLTIYAKSTDPKVRNIKPTGEHPSRDLRSILKLAVSGLRTGQPKVESSREPVGHAVLVRDGVVSNAGLMNVRHNFLNLPRVKTLFGGNVWVIRPLTTLEVLLAGDVPEKISKLATIEERDSLIKALRVPVKSLQAIAGVLSRIVPQWYPQRDRLLGANNKVGMTNARDNNALLNTRPMETIEVCNDMMTQSIDTAMLPSDLAKIAEAERKLKAVKADDAEVPIDLWDAFMEKGLHTMIKARAWKAAAECLRGFILRLWRRRCFLKFLLWKRLKLVQGYEPDRRDLDAVRDAVRRSSQATCWDWSGGSRLMFWAWPEEQQAPIRDGIRLWMSHGFLPWTQPQRLPKDPTKLAQVMEKLTAIRKRGYVAPGQVKSLTSFFEVPKGTDDIRMVYDGSKSGLNDFLWAPWFPLPTVESMLRSVEPGTFMADNDVGEMFLNFTLHENVQSLCGLDLTKYFPEEVTPMAPRLWERWNRCAMGLTTSPYQACQGMSWAMERVLGDRCDPGNVFRWAAMELNLPGSLDYDPSRPWVYKVREDGVMAADAHCYVDDVRITAPTDIECWKASQRLSTVLGTLGIQDAARKRRAPDREAGAWAGSVVHSVNGEVVVLSSQEKWDKMKGIFSWLRERAHEARGIPHKELESKRGFLIHMIQTYPAFTPYLKGIHATLDSWRPGRDADGWRQRPGDKKRKVAGNGSYDSSNTTEPRRRIDPEDPIEWEDKFGGNEESSSTRELGVAPKYVQPVARLLSDLSALAELSESERPPKRRVRMGRTALVRYGFGDASGTGFGSSIWVEGQGIFWRSGTWKWTIRDETSSNYKEFSNVVRAIEEGLDSGWLIGHELFMFTDNSTTESAYYRGTSSSRLLHELVIRLRKIEIKGNCRIFVIHVAGTRMIWQGTDGLSRGDKNAGVMMGEEMRSFIPLDLSANDRSDALLPWIVSWASSPDNRSKLKVLTPEEWLSPHSGGDTHLWMPPPAAANAAVEWLAKSIHKRPNSTHIVFIPRLMTAWWFKTLRKTSDLVFVIPTCCDVWTMSNHEPLICAVCLPLSRKKPWKRRWTPRVEELSRSLPEMWANSFGSVGPILRQLLVESRALAGV